MSFTTRLLQNRGNHKPFLYLITGKVNHSAGWWYVEVMHEQHAAFLAALEKDHLEVNRYGKVLFSGDGVSPPEDIKTLMSHYADRKDD